MLSEHAGTRFDTLHTRKRNRPLCIYFCPAKSNIRRPLKRFSVNVASQRPCSLGPSPGQCGVKKQISEIVKCAPCLAASLWNIESRAIRRFTRRVTWQTKRLLNAPTARLPNSGQKHFRAPAECAFRFWSICFEHSGNLLGTDRFRAHV